MTTMTTTMMMMKMMTMTSGVFASVSVSGSVKASGHTVHGHGAAPMCCGRCHHQRRLIRLPHAQHVEATASGRRGETQNESESETSGESSLQQQEH
jgi:hypothetical protein